MSLCTLRKVWPNRDQDGGDSAKMLSQGLLLGGPNRRHLVPNVVPRPCGNVRNCSIIKRPFCSGARLPHNIRDVGHR